MCNWVLMAAVTFADISSWRCLCATSSCSCFNNSDELCCAKLCPPLQLFKISFCTILYIMFLHSFKYNWLSGTSVWDLITFSQSFKAHSTFTDSRLFWHAVLLDDFETARYSRMLTIRSCIQRMMSWGLFANNGLLNPPLEVQPEFMILWVFKNDLVTSFRPWHPALQGSTVLSGDVKTLSRTKHLMSAFLQTSSLFHHQWRRFMKPPEILW